MMPVRKRGRPATFDRNAALRVATDLFWRHGYEGTSIAMLTHAIGVTAPTLYASFGSKEQLYVAALEAYRAPTEIGSADGGRRLSAHDLVAGFLRAKAAAFTDARRPRGCMIASGALRAGNEAATAVAATMTSRQTALTQFVTILEQSASSGDIPAGIDCEGLARFYTAVLQGMSVQAIDGANTAALNSLVDIAMMAWPSAVG